MGSTLSGLFGTKNEYSPQQTGGISQQQATDQYLTDLTHKAEIYQQQQNLAQALQQQMAGNGPNPAQTQFMGNQQANLANTQGLIASQRGLNPALAARMGVNAATQANSQSALGSALLQQQQQLNATSNLGNLYGQLQQGNQSNLGQSVSSTQSNNQVGFDVSKGNQAASQQAFNKTFDTVSGGAQAAAKMFFSHGGEVEGRANIAGDSLQNDTVHTMLSPGEIVIPRSMAHDPEKAKQFIDHLLKNKKESSGGYGEVVAARRKSKKK